MDPTEGTPDQNNAFMVWLEPDNEDGDEYCDKWDTREQLLLSSSVLRSEQNSQDFPPPHHSGKSCCEQPVEGKPTEVCLQSLGASMSKAMKPYGEKPRPNDWYSPKNCALQYAKLLSEVEEDPKKKTFPRAEKETPQSRLVTVLKDKRMKEIDVMKQEYKSAADKLKMHLAKVRNGDYDENAEDLVEQLVASDKRDLDDYNEYLARREHLNMNKKLNTSQIRKGKSSKAPVLRKKATPFLDQMEDSSHKGVNTNIRKEVNRNEDASTSTKLVIMKTNDVEPPIAVTATLDPKASIPSTVSPTSPLLTSLLRNVTATPGSHVLLSGSSPVKEPEPMDGTTEAVELISKSKETSPRSSVPQSPRPTPASSPLLNSLLKSSPSSSATSTQASPGKDVSPKAVSSPQPFFNPTSALATAAAQQLAVATSPVPQSHQFFQQNESPEIRKINLQSSGTSACLSAPTLSKLLEMPPSTPGRLPPLPVLDSPITATLTTPLVVTEPVPSVSKSSNLKVMEDLTLLPPDSPSDKTDYTLEAEPSFPTDTSVLQKSLTSYSLADKRSASSTSTECAKPLFTYEKHAERCRGKLGGTSQENLDMIEAVCASIDQAYDEDTKEEPENKEQDLVRQLFPSNDTSPMIGKSVDLSIDREIFSSDLEDPFSLLRKDIDNKEHSPTDDQPYTKPYREITFPSSIPLEPHFSKITDVPAEVDRGVSSRKFYKSRIASKKEESSEKGAEASFLSHSPKKSQGRIESENAAASFIKDVTGDIDLFDDLPPVIKSTKSNDSKFSIPKKIKHFERAENKDIEKTELSEDETAVAVRRSSRRGRKGRGKAASTVPIKQVEPKDQYEFTESTEENSVGYQASNTLCYMPRIKEDFRFEDNKGKLSPPLESEDMPSSASSPTTDSKCATPSRYKRDRAEVSTSYIRKSLFTSDEEKMSDSLTSDEASNHLLSEDKLKKWDETCEKKGDVTKSSVDNIKHSSKAADLPKKKNIPSQRISRRNMSRRKDKKNSSVNVEELSACSRDSDLFLPDKDVLDNKSHVPVVDLEEENNDSHLSSSIAAESDKQIDDVEGSESLQGSITTEFSSPSTNEAKDEKETSQFGKQDWFHIVSPKSSEAISQSSEESEGYESDNWDNQSVSTNKSASQSTGTQPRLKRKERETPEYKAWKKAISIVLREASCHKNANVFLQKVTNDVAPGYLNIVHRPMDLSLIKKNIDNGVIRTTDEFHRDMLLMFQNAIMYNSSDHDVHQMAVEMQRDVVQQITAFLTTQSNDKNEVSEPSSLRAARKSQKGHGKHSSAGTLKQKEEMD